MLIVVLRTLILYFSLILFLRLMGKRQVGELDISELVSALLLSEIVSLPIENADIPLSSALAPMLIIISLEIILSYALTKSELLKKLLTSKPSLLINRGVIDPKELSNSRVSLEELMSELRLKGIGEIGDVYYAILEQNGQISAILKKDASPLTCEDTNKKTTERGIDHAIIVDGHTKESEIKQLSIDRAWIDKQLSNMNIAMTDIFLMTINDAGETNIIMKGNNK